MVETRAGRRIGIDGLGGFSLRHRGEMPPGSRGKRRIVSPMLPASSPGKNGRDGASCRRMAFQVRKGATDESWGNALEARKFAVGMDQDRGMDQQRCQEADSVIAESTRSGILEQPESVPPEG